MGDAIISRTSKNGDSVTVVQETGTSTTDVMSQNATTKSLSNISYSTLGNVPIQYGGTGASTAGQARKNLNVPYLSPTYYSGDLNSLTDTGFYVVRGKGANTPPTVNATPSWLLMVISSSSTTLNVGTFQICSEIFNTQKTSVWARKCDGKTTWTSWENINYNSDPDVMTSITKNINIRISPSGSDTTGDGSSSSPYATLAKALSLISGKTINALVSVYIASGTYDEAINLVNYSGNGEIKLLGSSSDPASFKSCTIDDNTLRMIEIHDINIGTGSTSTMYVRQNTCYIGLHNITFNGVRISSSASNMIISKCSFLNLSTAIYTSPNGGAGGSGYDGTGQVVLKGTNTFTSVTTAVNVSGGSMLVLSTSPTLNGAKLTKTNGGMIIYPNGTFNP